MNQKELKRLEEIERYYLNTITKYIGADINGLVHLLQGHNRTWRYWFPKIKGGGSFDAGAERVVYMLLNRGDILGSPNSNPVGSDNSFLKYDQEFNQYLVINIDVKAIKSNSAFGDMFSNIPIGKNQNSYSCNIEYTSNGSIKELKKYTPGLHKKYDILDQHNEKRSYLSLSYEIVFVYEQLPNHISPKSEEVIGIFTTCVPNGSLYTIYKDKVFDAGKTSNLTLDADQIINVPGSTFISNGKETKQSICNKYNITEDDYNRLNGQKGLSWNVDGRFNYMRTKFRLLDDQPRIMKLFLKEKRFDHYLYHYDDKNGKLLNKRRNRQNKMEEAYDFLKKLELK